MLLNAYAAFEKLELMDPAQVEYRRALYANSVEPLEFARLAVQGVEGGALYVNSHRSTLDFVQERTSRMLADTNTIGTVI